MNKVPQSSVVLAATIATLFSVSSPQARDALPCMNAQDSKWLYDYVLAKGQSIKLGDGSVFMKKMVFEGYRSGSGMHDTTCLDTTIEAGGEALIFDAWCKLPINFQHTNTTIDHSYQKLGRVEKEEKVSVSVYGQVRVVMTAETGVCEMGGTPWVVIGSHQYHTKGSAVQQLLKKAGSYTVQKEKDYLETLR